MCNSSLFNALTADRRDTDPSRMFLHALRMVLPNPVEDLDVVADSGMAGQVGDGGRGRGGDDDDRYEEVEVFLTVAEAYHVLLAGGEEEEEKEEDGTRGRKIS